MKDFIEITLLVEGRYQRLFKVPRDSKKILVSPGKTKEEDIVMFDNDPDESFFHYEEAKEI